MTDTSSSLTRRRLLEAAGAGAAVNAFAFGTATAHEDSADEQLARVREATAQYSDVETAMADGYKPLGPFVPGMGWHFLNPANVQAAVENGLDVERPQLLTYGDTGAACGGDLVLGAVEYAIPVGARDFDKETPPDLFDDDAAEWHVHPAAEHAFALPTDPGHGEHGDVPQSMDEVPRSELFRTTNWIEVTRDDSGEPNFPQGTTFMADLEGGAPLDLRTVVTSSVHPDLWTLHAWVHAENPDGAFHETNAELPSSPDP